MAAATESNNNQETPEEPVNSQFSCNICLDNAKDPVVSQCGHLFCWPCLHRWLETRPDRQECPVCKSRVTKDKCTPIYGHGDDSSRDPRERVPPRPQGRQERAPNNESPFGGIFGNFGNSFGSGLGGNNGSNVHVNFSLFPMGLLGGLGGFGFGSSAFGNQQPTRNNANMDGNRAGSNTNRNRGTFQTDHRTTEQELIQNFFLWLALLFFIWFCFSD